MVRENNRKEFVQGEDELPKFGAGSEFGRQEKEEARYPMFWNCFSSSLARVFFFVTG